MIKISTLVCASVLVCSSAAFADHAVDNARDIAWQSYLAADAAEELETEARLDALTDLAMDAENLHLALSSLYRVARDGGRGEDIRTAFEMAEFEWDRVAETFRGQSPDRVSRRTASLFDALGPKLESLRRAVYGSE